MHMQIKRIIALLTMMVVLTASTIVPGFAEVTGKDALLTQITDSA